MSQESLSPGFQIYVLSPNSQCLAHHHRLVKMRVLHPVTSKMLLRSESLRGVDIRGLGRGDTCGLPGVGVNCWAFLLLIKSCLGPIWLSPSDSPKLVGYSITPSSWLQHSSSGRSLHLYSDQLAISSSRGTLIREGVCPHYTGWSIWLSIRNGSVVSLFWDFWGPKWLLCNPKTGRKLLLGQKFTHIYLKNCQEGG